MPLAQRAAELFGITLTPEQVNQFELYARLLVEWNTHTNLTAITDAEGIEVRHFLDSLSVIKALSLRAGMRLIDVGTGAGFPGVPLAIAFPGIEMTLLEATGKKVNFLNEVINILGLKDCHTLHARAEEAGQNPTHRARYNVVLARAVARLPGLLEYMLPLARVGGRCIAMKGVSAADEATDAKRALAILGGRLQAMHALTLPGVSDEHFLVVVEKISHTPSAYPRTPGLPTRKPL